MSAQLTQQQRRSRRRPAAGLTVGSLFSGIGGLELGLEWAGLGPVVWQVEQDEYCRRVLEKHWPHADRSVKDVRIAGRGNLQPVDIICGGFPCQDISYAGKGAGLAGERSGLWYEYARIVGELRPRFVVVENVAALLTRGVGDVLGTLAGLGYDAIWTTIRASDVGAPHRRERLFVVAYARCGGIQRERITGVVSRATGGAEGQGHPDRGSAGDGGEDVAHRNTAGRERQRGGGLLDGERQALRHDADGCGGAEDMDDAASARRENQTWGFAAGSTGASGRQTQPHLGLRADGFPHGLVRWPAGPGTAQYDWEPPRTVPQSQDRAKRLRALGNAVVPQVAFVVGMMVRELTLFAPVNGGAQ